MCYIGLHEKKTAITLLLSPDSDYICMIKVSPSVKSSTEVAVRHSDHFN